MGRASVSVGIGSKCVTIQKRRAEAPWDRFVGVGMGSSGTELMA